MTRIRLYEHTLAVVAPQEFEVPSLALWLLDHYGDVPTVKVQVFAGQPSADTDITDDVPAILAGAADEYVILQSPGFAAIPLWGWIVMAVVAVAVIALTPKPTMPGNINRTQTSPNNALGNRENKVRILERVEDIFGTVKSTPSLMMPTYNKYIGHKKYEYGYYCVSRGYCDLAELRDGDTLISEITGAAASVYLPFTSPNGGAPVLQVGDAIIDDIITAARAIEVDGITLKALNQAQLPTSAAYTFTAGGTVTQASKQSNINSVSGVGDDITILMADQTVVITAAVYDTSDPPVMVTPAVTETRNYSGTYEIASATDGAATLAGTTWDATFEATCSVQVTGVTDYADWVTLPDTERTEVWANVTAPNGMFKDSGGKSATTVEFAIEIEKLDPATLLPLTTPIVETVTSSLSGAVTDERADTIEHATAWTGPCRVRMRRTTAYDYAFSGTVQDEIKWADLYSITPVSNAHFGCKTTVHTITKATARATAVKSRQLNCIASRKLPIYNGTTFSGAFDSTGLLVSGTIAPTSKLVDIIAAVSVDPKIGARDLALEVDMAQIWGVQQQLDAWSASCGQFNYTFDSDNTSFEETLILIANSGFCIAYRQNGKIRLAFDKAQTSSTALFTHRNKKPRSETITRSFASDSDYDGVQLTYVDPDSDTSETISLPLDDSATKYKKLEIAGIRSFEQAWYRASREYAKLRGQRITLETTTTLDARSLLPNSRIDVVDNTRFKSYDGEVVGQSGLELTLSQDVAFTPALPHSIVLMRRDGSLQSIPVTAGSAANRVLLQSLPSEAIATTYGQDGIRTIYSFAADSARGAMAYLVQEIDISDGQYCTVRAINYSADYYAGDTLAVPAKATVIN
ncbi:MAG: host specificity factor TipJ family phage tail protein [Rhodoferax sp.]